MMTIHVLHAGDGYLYLIRSVAAHDAQRAPGETLAGYYAAAGQPPGRWAGRLATDLGVAGEVTEEQMCSLFGEGRHPNADQVRQGLLHDGFSADEADRAVRLGRRFPVYGRAATLNPAFAEAYRAEERSIGRGLTDEERLTIRQRVAAEDFERRTGRLPVDPVELEAVDRGTSRSAVAGYDFVFTPVKSVSVLWGLGSPETRRQIHEAHRAAVADAIHWLESNAAFTRTGTEGQAQIDTTGVMAATFDHWDSRAGDPDLHTHVAVSNKVRGADSKWRSLDGRALFAAAVSLSERYNTRIEDELRTRLGVRFTERGDGEGRRPVREIDGVLPALLRQFSKRRLSIEGIYRDQLGDYRATHGREPSEPARLSLYQQATLSERPEKQRGRSLEQMVSAWRVEAERVLGTPGISAAIESAALGHRADRSAVDVDALADAVLNVLASERSTWAIHHVRAEAHRQSRWATTDDRDGLVEQIAKLATAPDRSIRIETPRAVAEPAELRRADGLSVFVEHGSARFTTRTILDAEERIVTAARKRDAITLDRDIVRAAVDRAGTGSRRLNDGQRALVRSFCLSGRRAQLALAPAGAGKTTAMRAVADAWSAAGHEVIALAPSAAAADVLASEIGVPADTAAKFDHDRPDVRPGTLILVDEAGMTGTLVLDRLVARAGAAGAVVRLVGDDQQLGAVEAGGVIRQIAHDVGAVRMEQVVRFADSAEAAVTLQVRRGDVRAIAFYLAKDRVVAGTTETVPDAAYVAWLTDLDAGRDSLLLAPSASQVTALNARARADRVLAGKVAADGVALRDGTVAGVGDHITTRRNERLLLVHSGRDWVKNGDSWRVEQVGDDGTVTAVHRRHRGQVTLPADYVGAQVELDYARTIRRSQGLTVDRAHLLVDPRMAREDLYVGLTRARESTRLYVAIMTEPGPDHLPEVSGSAADVLRGVLARTGVELSAAETIRESLAAAGDLRRMAVEYEHALGVSVGTRYATAAESVRAGITADAAWPYVARRLHRAEADGWSVTELLRRAESLSGWADARSEAEVMAYRIDRLMSAGERRTERPVPTWLAPPPARHLEAPWDDYLPKRYRQLAERVRDLAAETERDGPQWLTDLEAAPNRPEALRQVVSYRAVYGITDPSPLGPEPALRSRQHEAWTEATRAARHHDEPEPEPAAAQRLLAELEGPSVAYDEAPPDVHRAHARHL
ncbi:conjugative relaxase-like TrwC/TraI family protein [Friedmanniella endophytica]|uniref:Conjugative relaxase-like TrwC/TraI family protein n=1 Tax=Microlunatus kandeliicorticis TaxID=1759536 RepID=A0A7W3IPG7_9ACTN|nr:MobF family relaxase [Microlunatus kandeliicorticis]MBA8792849.1 conjugative relaxase-like TrwC/TraI family protein [Microlunatus kandeliicorticis]